MIYSHGSTEKKEAATIGERLRGLRNESGMNKAAAAKALNISRPTLDAWESDKTSPTIADMKRLCSLYGCDYGYIVGEYDCKTRPVTDIFLETGLCADAAASLLTLNDREIAFLDALLSSRSDLYFIAAAFVDLKQKKALDRSIDLEEIPDDLCIETLTIKNSLDYARFTLSNRFMLFAEDSTK